MASTSLSDQTIKTTTSRTHLESSRSVHVWNIENVDRILPNEADEDLAKPEKDSYFKEFKELRSAVFTTTLGRTEIEESEQKWFVELHLKPPKRENNETALVEGNKYIAPYLRVQPTNEESNVKPVRLYVTFSILGKDEKEVHKRSTETAFEKIMEYGWGFSNFLPLSQLWKNKDTHIVENVLRIKVALTVYGPPLIEKMDLGLNECLSFAKKQFVDDMRHILNSGSDADVTIHCSGRNFFVHTPILKGRCVVFNRMLEADMKESKERVIKIDDVDPIVFEAFLEYIYTGQVELTPESMDKLLGLVQIADKYGVEELKSICFKYMAENISLENAGEIAVLALAHNADENIRFKIVNFCQSNLPSLLKKLTFKTCLSENPLAFFHDTTKNDESEVEMKD